MPNNISNISYTNKDFNTIFPELLELAKKISSRWDPTVSDESDPGVVLLKMNAIIADKNNYAIDKNILEAFPESVTQEDNARELFNQLGYQMGWYKSAVSALTVSWTGETSDKSISIPPFFQVTNESQDVVYTVLGNSSDDPEFMDEFGTNSYVGNITLPMNGDTVNLAIIQGTINKYTMAGVDLITLDKLDSENRIYFTETQIAQNGIYIENADISDSTRGRGNFNEWTYTTNLASESPDEKVYTFGVLNNRCYIEFSENISDVIGAGIYIRYIVSDGLSGNTSQNTLTKYYESISVQDPSSSSEKISITTDNTSLNNNYVILSGKDPENIDSAFKNYRRTVGTFKTLVSLRDYINYILTSGLVSNGFVCDRTNDVQCSYDIVANDSTLNGSKISYVERKNKNPLLQAFDLRFYLTQYLDVITSTTDYNLTFSPINSAVYDNVVTYIDSTKCIQHDISYPLPDRPWMYINKYPIKCTVVPKYKLTDSQQQSLSNNIRSAIYEQLNAKKIDFGQEISYDLLEDTIVNSDDRIKTVLLDDIVYTAYAIYYDSHSSSYKEVLISDVDNESTNSLVYISLASQTTFSCPVSPLSVAVNGSVTSDYTFYGASDNVPARIVLDTARAQGDVVQIVYSLAYMSKEFRKDIVAKSILAGTTYLYKHDDSFTIALNSESSGTSNEPVNDEVLNAVSIDTYMETVGDSDEIVDGSAAVTVRTGEIIQFAHPTMETVDTFSTNVKVLWDGFGSPIPDDATTYLSNSSEHIYLMWLREQDSSQYVCRRLTSGDTVHVTGTIGIGSSIGDSSINNLISRIASSFTGSANTVLLDTSLTSSIQAIIDETYILTSTKYVETQKVSETVLDSAVNYCYWKLNEISNDNKYVLFRENETEYTLQENEYFIIPNKERTSYAYIFGMGTKITRVPKQNASLQNDSLKKWEVNAGIDTGIFEEYGVSAYQPVDYFVFGTNFNVYCTDMTYVNIPAGYNIEVSGIVGTSAGDHLVFRSYRDNISYKYALSKKNVNGGYTDLTKTDIYNCKFQYYKEDAPDEVSDIEKFKCAPISNEGFRATDIYTKLLISFDKNNEQEVLKNHLYYINLRGKSGQTGTMQIGDSELIVSNGESTYAVQEAPSAVYVNDSLMNLQSDYTYNTSNNSITFTGGHIPDASELIRVVYQRDFDVYVGNGSDTTFEVYGNLSSVYVGSDEKSTLYVVDETTAQYNVSSQPTAVYVNGAEQTLDVDYIYEGTYTPKTITFTEGHVPAIGSRILICYSYTYDVSSNPKTITFTTAPESGYMVKVVYENACGIYSNPHYMQTDLLVDLVGGHDISLSQIDSDTGNYIYPVFYEYMVKDNVNIDRNTMDGSVEVKLNKEEPSSQWESDGETASHSVSSKPTKVSVNGAQIPDTDYTYDETSRTITFKDGHVPAAGSTVRVYYLWYKISGIPFKYNSDTVILPMQTNFDCDHLYVVKNGSGQVQLSDIHGRNDFNKAGMYYIVLNSGKNVSGDTLSIEMEIAEQRTNPFVKFGAVYEYSSYDSGTNYRFDDMPTGDILDRVSELDYDNVFNFTNEIADTDLIEDPLAGESFNRSNHVFNKYTICKISSLENLKISNKTR